LTFVSKMVEASVSRRGDKLGTTVPRTQLGIRKMLKWLTD